MKVKIGLVIGRFQPFHKGHLYLIKKALKEADKIIVAIGSSNISDENNPLSYKTRIKMLKKVIVREKLVNKVIKIIPSPDDPSDDIWLAKLLKNAGKFDIALGNNDWTNGILGKAGYKVLEIPYLKRSSYQGTVIRKLIKSNNKWENLVPVYLVGKISEKLTP
ncbi:MAG: adenylyltransferase/cytidyltransferase family protein [Patescibacteria group bacterium]